MQQSIHCKVIKVFFILYCLHHACGYRRYRVGWGWVLMIILRGFLEIFKSFLKTLSEAGSFRFFFKKKFELSTPTKYRMVNETELKKMLQYFTNDIQAKLLTFYVSNRYVIYRYLFRISRKCFVHNKAHFLLMKHQKFSNDCNIKKTNETL